jgi:molybdopterin-containing oxidoreductase family iron-sulfur binding subunit
MTNINRRRFLKMMGLATTSATVGCSADSARKLIPYIIPHKDIIPGEATWYASTCRECPAGCGILAKNRDGRIIKVEGNPDHPVNKGALCPRGQASLHGLYNPDRFTGPQHRQGATFSYTSWEGGEQRLVNHLQDLRTRGRQGRIIFLTGLVTDTVRQLITDWLTAVGGGRHVMWEPLNYEPLRAANRITFKENDIPAYRLDEADFLISFGADFLETWLSNVEYARRFAAFHEAREDRKNFFLHVGPRRSMTSAGSDLHIMVEPGDEWRVALALLRVVLDEVGKGELPLDSKAHAACKKVLATAEAAQAEAPVAVPMATLRLIADRFLRADSPLVLAGGSPYEGPHATATAVVANLLNQIKPGSRGLVDFHKISSLGQTASAVELKSLSEEIGQGEVDLLLVYDANPVYALPPSWKLPENFKQVGMTVSFAACPDETSIFADLILPAHTPLESWGDFSPQAGITGLTQPLMGHLFDSRELGDILLQTGKAAGGADQLPWPDFFALLQAKWRRRWENSDKKTTFQSFWNKAVQRGGLWQDQKNPVKKPVLAADIDYTFPSSSPKPRGMYAIVIYPTIQFYDGRGANRPWLQELPDPITQTTWGGWAEMHPQTAAALRVDKGDVIHISTSHGAIEVPVLPINTVSRGVVALPIGQGHTSYGRYADGLPASPMALLSAAIDTLSGGVNALPVAEIRKTGRHFAIAHTDGSYFQEGRKLAQDTSFSSYQQAVAAGGKPDVDMPMPSGFDRHRDMYPPHQHKDFRWCMVVDLDRCIGCGACVVACYAENNIAVVGREQMLMEREMSWLRIQRYFADDEKTIRYLPMLCQHCDEAPCESVCPVFAPHHSVEGLNNQVYNRCFGTRFCSQNDPYKVRRFNWFTFTRPTPLDWQLNPDVTVRQKGVMEKCSFCVQRIVAAKFKAKKEGHKLGDGEFTTACAQTCPVDALTFGSLLDPDSRVSRLIRDPRAYQVLRYLNTKPAVIYLKKLTQEL